MLLRTLDENVSGPMIPIRRMALGGVGDASATRQE